MTDNEIVKALEICNSDADAGWCDICPYEGTVGSGCSYNLISDTIALITRQKAEIERLQEQLGKMGEHSLLLIQNARAEAIKEFAERLKAVAEYDDVCEEYSLHPSDIDNLVEEMERER